MKFGCGNTSGVEEVRDYQYLGVVLAKRHLGTLMMLCIALFLASHRRTIVIPSGLLVGD